MRCVVCRNGTMQTGTTTVTLNRGDLTLVVKNVPALVCDNCDEEYVDEVVTRRLEQTANEAERAGVQVDVREYVAA